MCVAAQEVLEIPVKPGWKDGTRITYGGMGDELPGKPPQARPGPYLQPAGRPSPGLLKWSRRADAWLGPQQAPV